MASGAGRRRPPSIWPSGDERAAPVHAEESAPSGNGAHNGHSTVDASDDARDGGAEPQVTGAEATGARPAESAHARRDDAASGGGSAGHSVPTSFPEYRDRQPHYVEADTGAMLLATPPGRALLEALRSSELPRDLGHTLVAHFNEALTEALRDDIAGDMALKLDADLASYRVANSVWDLQLTNIRLATAEGDELRLPRARLLGMQAAEGQVRRRRRGLDGDDGFLLDD